MARSAERPPPDPRQLFLGVDGGGTKTHIVLIRPDRTVACEAFAGPSNPLRVGVETAVGNILAAVNEACDVGGMTAGDIVAATLGLAGVRRADIRQRVRDSFRSRLRVPRVEVVTDAEIALYAVTGGDPGIVIIAGTGSICIGRNARGETAVAGGWGPLAGDEGGGVGIAREALQAVAKASDGRGIATVLSERAAEYFRAAGPENLIVAIYSPQVDNARVAGFAKLVVESAVAGDAVASDIIRQAGFELGIAGCAVIDKLRLDGKFPVGCVGSLFKARDLLKGPMIETIHTVAPNAYLAEPEMPPARAAAIMALLNETE